MVRFSGLTLERAKDTEVLTVADPFKVRVVYHNNGILDDDMNITVQLYNAEDILVFTSGWRERGRKTGPVAQGDGNVWCAIPGDLLNVGDYRVVVNFFRASKMMFQVEDTIGFEVHDTKREAGRYGNKTGVFRPILEWGEN